MPLCLDDEDTVFARVKPSCSTVFARISLLAVYNASLYFLPWKIDFSFISGAAQRHGGLIVEEKNFEGELTCNLDIKVEI